MGICGPAEILTTLGAIERALYRLGQPVELGAGLAAAQQTLAEGAVTSRPMAQAVPAAGS
jgi:aspartate aminotransferase-like enzyme